VVLGKIRARSSEPLPGGHRTVYTLIARLLAPTLWWGRARVTGSELVPVEGAVLLVPNHDSQWDPIVVALALRKRRQLRFLARADLWRIFGLAPILRALRQIPIERGAGDRAALDNAVAALTRGEAICIFPEGKLSRGRRLPARSGIGWLATACPEAHVVLCAVSGASDYVRFPRRPRVSIEFFEPAAGRPRPGEDPQALAARLLDELRGLVPPESAGRRRRQPPPA
jgi:1-acyl-sn-glycerol-3-phosphate acyltransferase